MRPSMVAMAFLAEILSCAGHGTPASVCLTSYRQHATEGTEFTMSCIEPRKMIGVIWYRKNARIFDTSSDTGASTSIINPNNTSLQYQAVAGRVTVNTSPQQHNVSFRINSTLDKDSVWMCKSGNSFSNNITLMITDNTQGPTTTVPMTPGQTESTEREVIYAVVGSVGGVVVVAVIVIIVFLCTLSRRRENAKEEQHGKEGKFNEDSKRETAVMVDNDLYKQYADMDVEGTEHQVSTEKQEVIVMEDNDVYHRFVKAGRQNPAEKHRVPDVYSKVNKVKKTNNATEVQITLRIEDLYTKPNRTANGRSESSPHVSSDQNVDISTPD